MKRLVAFAVAANVALVALPVVPADAAQGLEAIDPLQSATTILANAPKTLTAAAITAESFAPPASPAIAFVPYAVTDPKTGQAVSPSTMITAPSGVQVAAGTYWSQVNALEQFFNTRGVSLRKGSQFDLGHLKGGTQADLDASKSANPDGPGAGVILKGVPADLAQVDGLAPKPVDLLPSDIVEPDVALPTPTPTPSPKPGTPIAKQNPDTHKPSPSPTPVNVDSLPLGYKDAGRKPLDPLPASQDHASIGSVQDVKFSKSKDESWGPKGYVDFYVSASLSAEAHKDGAESMHGKVAMGADLFGEGGDVATASITVSPDNDSVDIEAVGQSIYKKSGKNPLSDQFTYNGTFYSIGAPVGTGVSGLTIGATVSGIVGVGYAMDAARTDSVSFGPLLDIAGAFAAQVSILASNFLQLQAGLSGDLTIASVALPLTASAGFVVKDYRSGTSHSAKSIWACRLHYTYGLRADFQYKLLQGKLLFSAGGCIIICKTAWSYALFSWQGYSGKDTLFKLSGETAVGDLYSDLPEYGYHTKSSAKVIFSKDDSSGIPAACHDLYSILGQPQPT